MASLQALKKHLGSVRMTGQLAVVFLAPVVEHLDEIVDEQQRITSLLLLAKVCEVKNELLNQLQLLLYTLHCRCQQ